MTTTKKLIFINGEQFFQPETGRNLEIYVEELPKMGWIQITEIGQENIYFVVSALLDGKPVLVNCFCKTHG